MFIKNSSLLSVYSVLNRPNVKINSYIYTQI